MTSSAQIYLLIKKKRKLQKTFYVKEAVVVKSGPCWKKTFVVHSYRSQNVMGHRVSCTTGGQCIHPSTAHQQNAMSSCGRADEYLNKRPVPLCDRPTDISLHRQFLEFKGLLSSFMPDNFKDLRRPHVRCKKWWSEVIKPNHFDSAVNRYQTGSE